MSPRIPSIIIAASLASATCVQAEDAPAEKSATVETYQLKNRSQFTCVEKGRVPFWPIGWVKKEKNAMASDAPVVPAALIEPANFKVTSIMLGSNALAVINGRAYGEGEVLRQPRGAAKDPTAPTLPPGVHIRVQQILDGRVVLQCEQQTITAMLQRPELSSARRSSLDEDLLFQDR
jgi:hypothetical protein